MIQELINRMELRLTKVYKEPNPFIKPLWEKTEIQQKIKELEKIKKKI